MGLRERKKEHTRELLVEAALRLFAEHGYDDTTVEMITDEVMVSSRTFFRYFDTKDAVLAEPGFAVVDRLLERLRGQAPPVATGAGVLRLLAELLDEELANGTHDVMIRGSRQHPELLERSAGWRQRWIAYLAEGLAEMAGRREPTFEESVISATAIILVGVAVDEFLSDEPSDRTVVALTEDALALVCGTTHGVSNASSGTADA